MDHNRPFEANFRKSEKLCTCPLNSKKKRIGGIAIWGIRPT